uniref:TGF-beta family profile domain-containing protein n=2 Tax=Esox lucius TaxID=8010 RepID=A0AAY5KF70_ESOLU
MDRSTKNSKRSSRSSREEMLEESKDYTERTSKAKRRRKRRRLRPCALRQVEVTVGELGLGYHSDETLLFRYCSGRCNTRRRNYDITLEHMKKAGLIKSGELVRYSPCCRPITYEKDISFLDNSSKYHTVQEVSARECKCT